VVDGPGVDDGIAAEEAAAAPAGSRVPASRLATLVDELLVLGEDLDLEHVLRRVVAAGCRLTGARYGALGVVGPDRELSAFVVHGMTPEEITALGEPPHGRGVLGALIDDPAVLRLDDLTADPRSVGFPPGHPPMRSFLGAPLRVRGEIFGNLYLTEKPGGFTAEDERVVEALALAAGVTVANARLFAESEHRRRWVQASAEITTALLGQVHPQDALGLVVRQARELAAADGAALAVEDDDGQLVVTIADGAVAGCALGATLPDDDTLAGLAGVAVPFTAPAGGEGRLVICWADRAAFEAARLEASTIRGFADQAALALDRLQAQADRATLAVLEDRDRIARDLHDLVIQRLFATGLGLQGAARLAIRPEVRERITAAIDDLDTTIRDIRATIFALHRRPGDEDLRGELLDLVEEAGAKLGVVPALAVEGPVDTLVPLDVRPHLVAVLQEALSNAARHARATRVDITVSAKDGWVRARVRDDGRGIPAKVRESGLRNLRERAVAVGGVLEIGPADGGGTVLEWRAPLA
jgi:signal transduction histidine kinase